MAVTVPSARTSNEVAGVVHKGEWVVPQRGALVLRGDGGGQRGPNFMAGSVVVNAGTEEEGRAAATGFMEELELILRGQGG
jgi:hypothetical protein